MEEPPEIEHWKRISVLGSGAFGVVSLWQHKISDDYIAIKKCKFQTINHLSDRQKKRWENEVEIMKTLNCANIVSFKPLPKHLEAVLLKYNPTKLPLLSMEYCMKGNLRHVLTLVKNLSGLQEQEVKVVLADITNAVAYLHKFNITHRDIKPENIVLQHCNYRLDGIIYKLIDLGYAKELNDSVVSFVGTLHYLAPEIIKTVKYDHTVDYWSLGVVAFEIICGVLPFLPHYTPLERFPYIEKKKPEHICIYQLHSGSVAYSSELLKENNISNCLKQNVEVWLRHVLQYDATSRGEKFPNDTNVFDYLLEILRKKIVTVFSVHTLEYYSYEINESTLISTLKDWIARDTKVPKKEQVLLSNLEVFNATDEKYVVDLLSENDLNLFVFKKGVFIHRETFKLPKCVTILFENCTKRYNWRDLRILYIKGLFYLSQEEKILSSLKASFQLCRRYVYYLNSKLKESMQQIHKSISNVLIRVDCYHNLLTSSVNVRCDESFKQYLIGFHELMINLETSIHSANDLIKRVDILCHRQILLDKFLADVTRIINNCDISNEILRANDLILKTGSNSQDLTPRDMVKVLSSALKVKDGLLNNRKFQSYSKAMLVAIRDAESLQLWMEGFHMHVKGLWKNIDDNQKQQYKYLMINCSNQKRKSVLNGISNNYVHWDTNTIIDENQELRCQLEDALGQLSIVFRQDID